MKTDTIFYLIFQQFPELFFELIGFSGIDTEAYNFASVELKQKAFRIDAVYEPAQNSQQMPVFFVEVQFQKDSSFYRRFFAEIFLYLQQNESVNYWQGVVIYPTRSIETDDTIPYEVLLSCPQVQRVYLDELAAENSLSLAIVGLIVDREEMAVERGKELIARSRQEVEDAALSAKLLELIETILLYKLSNLSREELRAMLGLDEFKQTRLYQDIKLEGKEEGLEEGERRAKLEAIPRLLALGLSIEQVAMALQLSIEQVQQVAQSQSE